MRYLVDLPHGHRTMSYEADSASFEGGALALYNGTVFDRELVIAFGVGAWVCCAPARDQESE